MTQNERLDFLLHYLIKERKEYENIRVLDSHSEKQRYLRSLMNVRPPLPVSAEFLSVQDAYLSERLVERGVTRFQDLTPVQPGLYLWRGDITTLAADTIVNAATVVCWAASFPATAASTTPSTPMRAYSSVWNVPD